MKKIRRLCTWPGRDSVPKCTHYMSIMESLERQDQRYCGSWNSLKQEAAYMEFMRTVGILHICQDRRFDMLSFRQSRLTPFIRMIL